MNKYDTITVLGFGALLVTLCTGLVPVRSLIGATHYGLPFQWLIRPVVAPKYNPWKIDPIHLIIDFVVWWLMLILIVVVPKERAGVYSKQSEEEH